MPLCEEFLICGSILLQNAAFKKFPSPNYGRVAKIGLVETAVGYATVVEYYHSIEKSSVKIAEINLRLLKRTVFNLCISEIAPRYRCLAETAMDKFTLLETHTLKAAIGEIDTLKPHTLKINANNLPRLQQFLQFCVFHK